MPAQTLSYWPMHKLNPNPWTFGYHATLFWLSIEKFNKPAKSENVVGISRENISGDDFLRHSNVFMCATRDFVKVDIMSTRIFIMFIFSYKKIFFCNLLMQNRRTMKAIHSIFFTGCWCAWAPTTIITLDVLSIFSKFLVTLGDRCKCQFFNFYIQFGCYIYGILERLENSLTRFVRILTKSKTILERSLNLKRYLPEKEKRKKILNMKHFNKDQLNKINVLHLKAVAKQLHLKSIQHCKKIAEKNWPKCRI